MQLAADAARQAQAVAELNNLDLGGGGGDNGGEGGGGGAVRGKRRADPDYSPSRGRSRSHHRQQIPPLKAPRDVLTRPLVVEAATRGKVSPLVLALIFGHRDGVRWRSYALRIEFGEHQQSKEETNEKIG